MAKNINPKSLAGIQYLGLAGISASCLDAVFRLIHFGDKINQAKLLSCANPCKHSGTHCFLLNINSDELIVINTGFSSGYQGEGPAALSTALQLLFKHGVEIDEYEVSPDFVDRVEKSCLTLNDIETLASAKPFRPTRWYDYVLDQHGGLDAGGDRLLRRFPQSMPFGIIDSRLYDLAMGFETQPDNSIMLAYRRLEDIVRTRTGLKELSNTKLFIKAFSGEDSLLYWKDIDDAGEQAGRVDLFRSIFSAFRNRRAHREPAKYIDWSLQEFLLVNQLYLLEKEAVKRDEQNEN